MSYSLYLTVRLKKGRGEKAESERREEKKIKWKRGGGPYLELGQKMCVWKEWGHEIQPTLTQLAASQRKSTHTKSNFTTYTHTNIADNITDNICTQLHLYSMFTSRYVMLYVFVFSRKDHHYRTTFCIWLFCIREWHCCSSVPKKSARSYCRSQASSTTRHLETACKIGNCPTVISSNFVGRYHKYLISIIPLVNGVLKLHRQCNQWVQSWCISLYWYKLAYCIYKHLIAQKFVA